MFENHLNISMQRFNLILLTAFILSVKVFSQDGVVNTFYPTDTLKSRINYSNKIREGSAKFYYPNGQIKQELNYVNGKVEGVVKSYYETGVLKEMYQVEDGKRQGPTSLFDSTGKYLKDINYISGKLMPEESIEDTSSKQPAAAETNNSAEQNVTGQKISQLKNKAEALPLPPNSESKKEENSDYNLTAEVMPEPVGGMQKIMSKLVYPEQARKDGIQGVVKVKALIDEYGEVTHAEAVQGIGHGCDEAARIAIYYAQFTPGLIKGKPVKVQMVIPIDFKLNGK